MPVSKKRKTAATSEGQTGNSTTPALLATSASEPPDTMPTTIKGTTDNAVEEDNSAGLGAVDPEIADREQERQERFKALQARAKKSAQRNFKEAAAESQRLATDPNVLSALSRKQAFASHNLLKADTAAAGEDFERKRAWDWTVDESEKWDKRMMRKEKHREDVAFQDYRQDSRKVYKRQLREMKPNLEGYEKEKAAAVQKAAMSGGLEVVETDDGELVAVDKNGTFYSTADSTDFIENKPEKVAVDRLVTDLRKAEETRLRKRRDRGKGEEEGDVTYINDKNKEFNKRLARSYNKYTAEIRDSFERGTMI
ncbi:pre-mRNA-splicing factor syf2 [Lobaria immixta]|nr:pre-mRNA-splicing factor syf2 [Lobaria immixta]